MHHYTNYIITPIDQPKAPFAKSWLVDAAKNVHAPSNTVLQSVLGRHRETEAGCQERYKLKWAASARDCDVIETSVTPNYQVRSGSGRTTVTALKPGADLRTGTCRSIGLYMNMYMYALLVYVHH